MYVCMFIKHYNLYLKRLSLRQTNLGFHIHVISYNVIFNITQDANVLSGWTKEYCIKLTILKY